MVTIHRLAVDALPGVYDIDMTERGAILYRVVDRHLEAVDPAT